jgi:hypothetical protein
MGRTVLANVIHCFIESIDEVNRKNQIQKFMAEFRFHAQVHSRLLQLVEQLVDLRETPMHEKRLCRIAGGWSRRLRVDRNAHRLLEVRGFVDEDMTDAVCMTRVLEFSSAPEYCAPFRFDRGARRG